MEKTSLLLGCGHNRKKCVCYADNIEWGNLITLDMNPAVNPDVLWSLDDIPLPFDDESFDELAAYDVLEHCGRQGDWRGYFSEFQEYHRILKPGGLFGILVPIGEDALTDPGHTRFFHQNYFHYLTKRFYEENLLQGAPGSDYRNYVKSWWEIEFIQKVENHHLAALLRKV